MTSLPLSIKISIAKDRIRDWYNTYDGLVYVARSGGKDSDVLAHLVRQMYPDVPNVYSNAGLDYSSVREHAQEECDRTLYPSITPVQTLTECGYPVISKEVSQAIREARIGLKLGNGTYQYRIDKLNGTYIDPKTGELSQYNMPQYKFLLDAPFRISEECCDNSKKLPFKKYDYIMRGGMFDSEGMWVPGNGGLGYKFVIDWLNKHGNLKIRY